MTELKQVKTSLCPALFYVLFPVPVDGAFWILVTYQRGTKQGVVYILLIHILKIQLTSLNNEANMEALITAVPPQKVSQYSQTPCLG